MASGKFKGNVEFTGPCNSKGKLMSNKATRQKLKWQPKYSSFEDFMHSGAADVYAQSDSYAPAPTQTVKQ